MKSKQVGFIGEKIALGYLKNKGYQILDKNYSVRFSGPIRGEIDIIAKKKDIISFVEVKTSVNRGQSSDISPEEKVDFSKERKIVRTAESWLMKKKIPLNSKWQIDVIAVETDLGKRIKISHFENAVSG